MASIDNNVLDDPLVGDGDVSFTKGVISALPANTIDVGSFADGENMDFDPFGRLVTRRGAKNATGNVVSGDWEAIASTWDSITSLWGTNLSSTAVDAAGFFDTGANQYIIVAQGGSFYYANATTVFTSIATGTYSGSTVYFAQLANRMYYADETNALKYIDSSVAYSAITAGKVSSIKITTQGIGYTSVPAITFSSGVAAATAVLGYGGRVVSATVTTPSSGYSATTPPTISFAAAPAGGTTAVGVVNISQTPSKPKYLTSHQSRLFCASADTAVPQDTVYVSDILDGDSWDLVGNSLRVGGDGDAITGLFPWFGSTLLVFKARSIWAINADPLVAPSSWEIKLINNRVGCVSHRTIQAVGADVYFLSRTGVRTINQIQAGTQTEVGNPISAQIQDRIDSIDFTYISKACSASYRNRYFLAVPLTGYTTPNHVLVYNALTQSWLPPWTGWQPREFVITSFSGIIRLCFASNVGQFLAWDDYTPVAGETASEYKDATTTYPSSVTTRAYTCNEPLVKKLGYTVEYQTGNTFAATQAETFSYAQDLSTSFTAIESNYSIPASTGYYKRVWPTVSYGPFNSVQYKIAASMGKIALNSVSVTGFVDNISPTV